MPPTTYWEYPIHACDVEDKDRLSQFRSKAEDWLHALDKDEENSITQQYYLMMWDNAAWRALNEARLISRDRDDSGTPGIVASLLDRGYISGQIIAISRLLERGASRRCRQVNSLRRLVDEIKENRDLLTREVYVCRDGLPYDWQQVSIDLLSVGEKNKAHWLDNTGPKAWGQSMTYHELFDELSGVGPNDRSRTDTLSDSFFERLSEALEDQIFRDIKAQRDKLVAHAANEFSRNSAKNLRNGMKLEEFDRAHFIIMGVVQVISSAILHQSWLGNAVPAPQLNVFEGLDRPIVRAGDLTRLHTFWDQHSNERDNWLQRSHDEILGC